MLRIIFILSLSITALSFGSTEATAQSTQQFLKNIDDILQGKNSGSTKRSKKSTSIVKTQAYLNALGFDAGPADGFNGPKTRKAISAYQSARGYRKTGKLRKREFEALQKEARAVIATTKPNPTKAQKQMAELGYYDGPIDGNWGKSSKRALEKFRANTKLPAGGPLNMKDMVTLQASVIAGQSTPDAADVFDTITLFGNDFTLSEPFLEATELTWADVKPYSFVALPQAKALVMKPQDAEARVAQKSRDLSAAYQAQIDLLYILLKPQIQTYVENNLPAGDVQSTVENYDIEVAQSLMSGNGLEMIERLEISTPNMAEVINIAQSTTHQLQAMQAIAENTLDVVPAKTVITAAKPDNAEISSTAIPAAAQVKMQGMQINGNATGSFANWPYLMTITKYDHATGAFTATLEWASLFSIHEAEGTFTGDGHLRFTETRKIKSGMAVLGCEYDLKPTQSANAELQGSYFCDGQSGTASAQFPKSLDFAMLPMPDAN